MRKDRQSPHDGGAGSRRVATIGFLVNPVAGMGGRVGLKGTDGVAGEAIRRGATPVAPQRARQALAALRTRLGDDARIAWLTCSDAMGAAELAAAGFDRYEIVHRAPDDSGAEDTASAARAFIARKAALVLFCGGDGTARDICDAIGHACPVLGIPAGVKMYSGVFAVTPSRAADILARFVQGELAPAEVDVLDLDEERYRRGEWAVRLYLTALTPFEPAYTQAAKVLIAAGTDDDDKRAIADELCEQIAASPQVLYILGPGSTVKTVADALGVDKTLLGIDAFAGGRVVGRDLDEDGLLSLLGQYESARLVLSPIGAQGFVVGRGNLPISARVIRRVGTGNLVVVATPAKLARTGVLRFDSGDSALDDALAGRGYLAVMTGYRRRRMVKAAR